MRWNDLFPYKPYPQQVEFMDDVSKVLENKGVIVAEACNGFGKTACSLASPLPLNRKVIYATRTHEQARQVLNEIKTMNKHANTCFSAVTLASREHLCMNKKCKGLFAAEAAEVCKRLRIFPHRPPPPEDRYTALGRDAGTCERYKAQIWTCD